MPITGKLRRGASGRLERAGDGTLNRCGCCSEHTEDCFLVVRAVPCYVDCTEEQEHIWVCTDTTCPGTGLPISSATPQVFSFRGKCWITQPTKKRTFATIPEGDDVIRSVSACYESCLDTPCVPEGGIPNTCPCVCYAYATVGLDGTELVSPLESYCCLGELLEGGEICFDWDMTGYYQIELENAKINGGPFGCPIHLSDDCQNNRSCLWYRDEFYSKNPTGYEICQNVCCRTKEIWLKSIVRKIDGSDPCGSSVLLCCGCPNVPITPDWYYGDEAVCPPVNLGTYMTVETLYSETVAECLAQAIRTTTYVQTCEGMSHTQMDEQWSYWLEYCPEFGDNCCKCQTYQKVTDHRAWTFYAPGSGDAHCSQCKEYLESLGGGGGGGGGLPFYLSGPIDVFLYA